MIGLIIGTKIPSFTFDTVSNFTKKVKKLSKDAEVRYEYIKYDDYTIIGAMPFMDEGYLDVDDRDMNLFLEERNFEKNYGALMKPLLTGWVSEYKKQIEALKDSGITQEEAEEKLKSYAMPDRIELKWFFVSFDKSQLINSIDE